MLCQLVGSVLSFTLPAWAVKAAEILPRYAPFSWVAAGFVGLMIWGLFLALYGFGKSRIAGARLQNKLTSGTLINPLDSIFERKRIYIAGLCPPVGGIIRDKTFVDCDLIGPANLMFGDGCSFDRNAGEVVDAICLKNGNSPRNGFGFEGCSFTRCSFYFVTFMVAETAWDDFKRHNWHGLNWITDVPQQQLPNVPQVPPQALPQISGTLGRAS